MPSKISEALYQVVVNLRSRRSIAYNEPLADEVAPVEFRLAAERVVSGKDDKYPLPPKLIDFAIGPLRRTSDERNVKSQLTNRRNMIRWIAVYQLDSNLRVLLVISTQQLRQEARGERGEYPDLDPTVFGASDRGDVLCTILDLPKRLSRVPHEALPGQRQNDTAIVPLKERGAQVILKIADSTADR